MTGCCASSISSGLTCVILRKATDQCMKQGTGSLRYFNQAKPYKAHTLGPFGQSFQRRNYVAVDISNVRRRHKADSSHTPQPTPQNQLVRALRVLESPTVPSESTVIEALSTCQNLARSFSKTIGSTEEFEVFNKSPASNLLNLEEYDTKSKKPKNYSRSIARNPEQDLIGDTAYRIVTDPKVFLTPQTLAIYIDTLTLLRCPQSFPQVFDLYAAKPIPRNGSSPITYFASNPNSLKAAISLQTSNTALEAAIRSKDLALCLNVITTTVATSAFRRAKYMRNALLPTTALALSPVAAYLLGKAFSDFQERLDPLYATWMGAAGFMTYFGMTALSGYIAITTSNDQMDRVTWRVGTPLYQRWFREEERAFTDKVAQAWGFQDYLKRGEEEGEDWKNLKNWIMERNMDLDKPELMEGME